MQRSHVKPRLASLRKSLLNQNKARYSPAQHKYEAITRDLTCVLVLKALTLGRNTEGDFVSDGEMLRDPGLRRQTKREVKNYVTVSLWRNRAGCKEDVVSDLSF